MSISISQLKINPSKAINASLRRCGEGAQPMKIGLSSCAEKELKKSSKVDQIAQASIPSFWLTYSTSFGH